VIIPHHRENRLFVILAEQEFFCPVVVLSPKFLSGLRMTVGVCEIARMIAQLKIANSPYYGQTSHRAPVLFWKTVWQIAFEATYVEKS
jgi:hypothetical protein